MKAAFERVSKNWAAVSAAVAAGPLGIWAGEIDPPDPAGLAVTIAIPFCCVFLFLVWIWGSQLSDKIRKILASITLISCVPVLAFYLITYFNLVVTQAIPSETGMRTVRITVGNEFRQSIEAQERTPRELLMDYAFDPGKIWTRQSIQKSQLQLNALFILSFSLLSAGTALCSIKKTGQVENNK